MPLTANIKLVNRKDLDRKLRQAIFIAEDLREPLEEIADEWFESNKEIFKQPGPGRFTDLSDLYKQEKGAEHGFIYPILRAEGRLERSLIHPNADEAVFRFIGKKTVEMGTSVPYATRLHFGDESINLPSRKFVLPDAGSTLPEVLDRRPKRFIQIFRDYFKRENKKL